MSLPRPIELLSPARDLACGMAAIDCGADAVYIGAPKFGARAAAGNSIEDISKLVTYAHRFGARVYATLNTILYDSELEAAHKLALQLCDVGVDALITQDIALLQMHLPIPLNASTQMDIRTPEKALWLAALGYNRLILARELSLRQIEEISNELKKHRNLFKQGRNLFEQHPKKFLPSPNLSAATLQGDVPSLEVFVHGALCVSYSGRCYASQYCFGRSANRGECAQFCRLAFNLEDADGKVLQREKHLLSLKDMNRSSSLEDLIDSGISSFKIEGRLKSADYVKNVTAYYRRAIDRILKRRPDLRRASYGQSTVPFQPNLSKSFNRGFTEYFLHGRTENVANFNTPKSMGAFVGHVKNVRRREIRVSGTASFHNGDGLCFFDKDKKLRGFRVNKAENNILYLAEPCPWIEEGMALYRNYDAEFVNCVEHAPSKRTLWVDLSLKETAAGFLLSAHDEAGRDACCSFPDEKQPARTPQLKRIETELSKLGGTIFRIRNVSVEFSIEYFLPAARVAEWRRKVVDSLNRMPFPKPDEAALKTQTPLSGTSDAKMGNDVYNILEGRHLDYTWNISNAAAREFCLSHGAVEVDPAFEQREPSEPLLMTCRHCLKYALGWCRKYGGRAGEVKEPLYLSLPDGKRFRLSFDCKNCQMKVYATR